MDKADNKTRYKGLISDPNFYRVDFSYETGYNTYYPQATYAGFELPVRTLYDAIGWILSITAIPTTNIAGQNNFCLPLLGLFGKWCSVLLPVEMLPAMLHVAYWYEQGQIKLILGATPGADHTIGSAELEVWHQQPLDTSCYTYVPKSTVAAARWSANKEEDVYWGVRGWDIIASRQRMFKKYGMVVEDIEKHEVKKYQMFEAKSGYGRCAETFIYLLLLQCGYAALSVRPPLLLLIETGDEIGRYPPCEDLRLIPAQF